MRVICWNLNAKDLGWPLFDDLQPDVALLSEVRSIPDGVRSEFSVLSRRASTRTGKPQRFSTVLLARGGMEERSLGAEWEWVEDEIRDLEGNLVAGEAGGLNLLSAYSPPWPVKKSTDLAEIPTADEVKLANNPDLWGTELLWAALRHADLNNPWIVGGDLNACETFDSWGSKPRGNREFLDRMIDLGFTEVLRHATGEITPTYLNFKTKKVRNQMDHLFVTADLLGRLVSCEVADPDVVFGEGLSDHLPIIADFDLPGVGREEGMDSP